MMQQQLSCPQPRFRRHRIWSGSSSDLRHGRGRPIRGEKPSRIGSVEAPLAAQKESKPECDARPRGPHSSVVFSMGHEVPRTLAYYLLCGGRSPTGGLRQQKAPCGVTSHPQRSKGIRTFKKSAS